MEYADEARLQWWLKQCRSLKHLLQVHGFMLPRALHHHHRLLSLFVHASSSLGFPLYASSAFALHSRPRIYFFNTLITSLSCPLSAVLLYNAIPSAALRPDSYSLPFALKAVIRLRSLQVARQFHAQAIFTGLDSFIPVVTALVQTYASCSGIADARKLFDVGVGSGIAEVSFWNAIVAGYAKADQMDSARHLFDLMPHRDVISWTTLVAGYGQADRPLDALAVFRRMLLEKVRPDDVAMLAALSACAHLGALQLGKWIHSYIYRHGLDKTVSLSNALMDMYSKSGNIRKALQVFEDMKHTSVVTWTTVISGLALHGLGTEAVQMFSRMERANIKPNAITFIAILSACTHVGLLGLARWFFFTMQSRYGIKPQIEHYGCMIDLLARAGYLRESQELVKQMPFEANAAIWGSLLASSNIHGDAKLGEIALRHLMKLEPWNSGNYALLSNIYYSTGRWNESAMMRKVMRATGVRKIRGCSSIESGDMVHEFIAGDATHSQFDSIRAILSMMSWHLTISLHQQEEFCQLLEFDG